MRPRVRPSDAEVASGWLPGVGLGAREDWRGALRVAWCRIPEDLDGPVVPAPSALLACDLVVPDSKEFKVNVKSPEA